MSGVSAVERYFRRGGCSGNSITRAERRQLCAAIWADFDKGMIKLTPLAIACQMSTREAKMIGTAVDAAVSRAGLHTPTQLRMAIKMHQRVLMVHTLQARVSRDIRGAIGGFIL